MIEMVKPKGTPQGAPLWLQGRDHLLQLFQRLAFERRVLLLRDDLKQLLFGIALCRCHTSRLILGLPNLDYVLDDIQLQLQNLVRATSPRKDP